MIRRPPRSTQSRSSAASDVYKRQPLPSPPTEQSPDRRRLVCRERRKQVRRLSLIHISEPTRLGMTSYAVFCLKKKKKTKKKNKKSLTNNKKYTTINKKDKQY